MVCVHCTSDRPNITEDEFVIYNINSLFAFVEIFIEILIFKIF